MTLESTLQNKITRYLKEQKRFYIKTQGGVSGTAKGTPDIITIDDLGVLVGIELKRPDHVGNYGVTNEQKYQAKKIQLFNGRWYMVDSWEKFLRIDLLEVTYEGDEI